MDLEEAIEKNGAVSQNGPYLEEDLFVNGEMFYSLIFLLSFPKVPFVWPWKSMAVKTKPH
jgi:hypothetical protein